MHPNQSTLTHFYAAFARLDADAMAACYAPDASFDDAAFSLQGHEQVTGMWRMLCDATRTRGLDAWKLTSRDINADSRTGTAHWEAWYRFSATGRLVHNRIASQFEFNDQGLICRQHDRFDFWAWSRQALGLTGLVLGWTPWLRHQVRAQAAANLQKYLAQRTR